MSDKILTKYEFNEILEICELEAERRGLGDLNKKHFKYYDIEEVLKNSSYFVIFEGKKIDKDKEKIRVFENVSIFSKINGDTYSVFIKRNGKVDIDTELNNHLFEVGENKPFKTIQSAISAVPPSLPGNTKYMIVVGRGGYTEEVKINKPNIELIGNEAIIQGSINVSADNVHIANFVVSGTYGWSWSTGSSSLSGGSKQNHTKRDQVFKNYKSPLLKKTR